MENTVKDIFGKQLYPGFSWLDDNKHTDKDDETKEVSKSGWDDEARTNHAFPYNDAEDESKEEIKNDGAKEAPKMYKKIKITRNTFTIEEMW